jgi:hypothetical protein
MSTREVGPLSRTEQEFQRAVFGVDTFTLSYSRLPEHPEEAMHQAVSDARARVRADAYVEGPIEATTYPALGYREAGDRWRIIVLATGRNEGPFYLSEGELLADLDRYTAAFGYDRETARDAAA